jgi:hypothetical protein
MAKRKRTDVVKLQLRIRESLRKQLEDAARVKDVSLNSEMVSRLEESFTRANMQDELNKMRENPERTFKEVAYQSALLSARKIESESVPPVINERQRLEALTAGNEELEARLKASLSRSEKLEAQLTAMLEARQSKGGKP